MASILVLEDEDSVNRGIEFSLSREGYEVSSAKSIQEGWELFLAHPFEMIICDINLPDGNGLDFIRKVREKSNVYIICLTALDQEFDQVMGYEAGADDYVTKPFGMMELVSRIKAVLRRSGQTADKADLEIDGVKMNVKKHEVTVDGQTVTLTLKEYELLERLMRNRNIVLTRDQLLEDIWGYDFDGETRTVDVHVRTLRHKLGEKGAIIETVRGVGYRIGEAYES